MASKKGNPLQVLIADDSEAMQSRLTALLSQMPRIVVIGAAKNGLEALKKTRALRPDVLLLDLHMPRMGGLAVLKKLRQQESRVIVIVLTNHTEFAYRDRLLAAGADYFCCKATQIDELERVLQGLAVQN